MTTLIFLLIFAHFLGDFPLQNTFMATHKSPNKVYPWFIVLTAHSVIHGGLVFLVLTFFSEYSQEFVLSVSLCEIVLHGTIDYLKSQNQFGHISDQVLHIEVKLMYIFMGVIF